MMHTKLFIRFLWAIAIATVTMPLLAPVPVKTKEIAHRAKTPVTTVPVAMPDTNLNTDGSLRPSLALLR